MEDIFGIKQAYVPPPPPPPPPPHPPDPTDIREFRSVMDDDAPPPLLATGTVTT